MTQFDEPSTGISCQGEVWCNVQCSEPFKSITSSEYGRGIQLFGIWWTSIDPGKVCLSSWLESQGISHNLQKYYRRAGWLTSVGRGAYCRPNEKIGWEGAVHALQSQANKKVHLGALVALAEFGSSHNIKLGRERVDLFSPLNVKLPAWFSNYDWACKH